MQCNRENKCNHCSSVLLSSESSHFCCQSGQHVVDFTQYFQCPGASLLRIFNDSVEKEGAPLGSRFSALSRKYNSLFSLAQHEIQSNSLEREIKLHTPHAPTSIRIHDTMYRKVHSTTSATPLRYLLFDPKARGTVANQQHLNVAVVKAFCVSCCCPPMA